MAKKPKESSPTQPPVETQPKSWETLTDSEKIERLGIVVNRLQEENKVLKRAFLSHNHADGMVVGKMTF